MRKTIIYLPEETVRQLKYLALDADTSMAELIRRAVARFLKTRTPRKAVAK